MATDEEQQALQVLLSRASETDALALLCMEKFRSPFSKITRALNAPYPVSHDLSVLQRRANRNQEHGSPVKGYEQTLATLQKLEDNGSRKSKNDLVWHKYRIRSFYGNR